MQHPPGPSMRAALVIGLIVTLALSGLACHTTTLRRASDAGQLSPKLNPFVFYEEGTLLFIGVDGRAAQYVKQGTIFPLGIGLANVSMGSLTVSRESFVLEDEAGNRYPVVSHQEYLREYNRSRVDEKLADTFAEVMATRYRNFQPRSWRLFPLSGERSPASESIELGRLQWTRGYLYFPMPASGIHGKTFNLLVKANEVPDTLVVSFRLR